jgi:hypothetical protein
MKHCTTISLIIILTAFFACSEDPQILDKNIEAKAINVAQQLDSNSISVFREWGFGTRGQVEIWNKQAWDSSLYNCLYFDTDTIRILVGQLEGFKKDFPYDFVIDTSIYHGTNFFKINDTTIRITAYDSNGQNHILSKGISLKTLFKANDPFEHFKSLSDFKDRLVIDGTFYRPDIGNFIQFYLSPQHILTYLPDNLNLNPKFKDEWLNNFATGKTIKKNWNLRKLDKALDNG